MREGGDAREEEEASGRDGARANANFRGKRNLAARAGDSASSSVRGSRVSAAADRQKDASRSAVRTRVTSGFLPRSDAARHRDRLPRAAVSYRARAAATRRMTRCYLSIFVFLKV